MKREFNEYDFINAMMDMRPDNFTYDGLKVLWEHFEQWEEDSGMEMNFDCIDICCSFSEDSIENHLSNYDLESLDELRDNTSVIMVDEDNCIIQNY